MEKGFNNWKLAAALPAMLLALGVMLFLPAGTLYWPEAWVYLIVQTGSSGLIGLYLWKNNPGLLKERLSVKGSVKKDRVVLFGGLIPSLLLFIVSGLDFRFGWSSFPLEVEAAAVCGIGLGMAMFFLTVRENSFLARVVRVQKEREQKVISTGPYAHIRHPMYLGVMTLYTCVPISLGSLYAIPFALVMDALIIFRISIEEGVLHKELEGYTEYTKKVKYRLIPGLW